MNVFRTTRYLALVAIMLISALAASGASAQRPGTSSTTADEGTYESELTGLEFSWSDDWNLSSTDVSDEEEILELVSDYGYLFTGFGLYADAPEALEDVMSGFEGDTAEVTIIDEDESRGFVWSLFELTSGSDEPVFFYVEVEEDYIDDLEFITVVASPEEMFLDQYELANDTVELDGDAVLEEFGVDEVEDLLGGSVSTTDEDTDTTPEADDEDQNETGRANDDAIGDSHMFSLDDIEVVVSDDISISDIQEEDNYEQILITGNFSIGAISLLQSPTDAEVTLNAFMEGFLGEMSDSSELDSGVDGSVAWALYEASTGGTDMYVYVVVNDDLYDGHYLELVAAPTEDFEDEFIAFQESVEINGTGMFDGVDIDDLLDIIDAS